MALVQNSCRLWFLCCISKMQNAAELGIYAFRGAKVKRHFCPLFEYRRHLTMRGGGYPGVLMTTEIMTPVPTLQRGGMRIPQPPCFLSW